MADVAEPSLFNARRNKKFRIGILIGLVFVFSIQVFSRESTNNQYFSNGNLKQIGEIDGSGKRTGVWGLQHRWQEKWEMEILR